MLRPLCLGGIVAGHGRCVKRGTLCPSCLDRAARMRNGFEFADAGNPLRCPFAMLRIIMGRAVVTWKFVAKRSRRSIPQVGLLVDQIGHVVVVIEIGRAELIVIRRVQVAAELARLDLVIAMLLDLVPLFL